MIIPYSQCIIVLLKASLKAIAIKTWVKEISKYKFTGGLNGRYDISNFKQAKDINRYIEHMSPNGKNRIIFGNIVRSGGFCTDRSIKKAMSNQDLGLHDFSIEETGRSFILTFLDSR